MVDARTEIGAGLAAVGLALVCSTLTAIDLFPATQPSRADRLHPVAALAWVAAHCDSRLILRPGMPRLQTEDLIELAAAFNEMARQQGHTIACGNALALAAPVAISATMAADNSIAFAHAYQAP